MNEEKKVEETKIEETAPAPVEEKVEQVEQLSQIKDLLLGDSKPEEKVEETAAVEKLEKKVETVVEETKVEKETEKVEETEKPKEVVAETETETETKVEEVEKKPEEAAKVETKTEEVPIDDHWRHELNEMAKKAQGEAPAEKPAEKPAEETKVEETKAPEPAKQTVIPSADITISEEDFEKATENAAGLQEVLARKVGQAVEGRLTEILKAIPKVLNDSVDERVAIQMAASDFYRDNRDLIPFKAIVKMEANKVFSDNPGIELEEGFEKTGEEVRKKLKLSKSAASTETIVKDEGKPAFVNKSSTRTIQAPKLAGVKSEIAETLEIN